MQLEELLKIMVHRKASDLHLRVPSPPVLRIDGVLVTLEEYPPLTAREIESIFDSIVSPEQKEIFQSEHELDFAYSMPGLVRSRVNVLRQRGTLSIAFRFVPFEVKSIDVLELPQILKELVLAPRGLILLTGSAGVGKSTTLAAMIDHLNETERRNVITIEEPVEYLHRNKKCVIAQRELGDDTKSFAVALMHALRHDPDVIVVGEMRDLATISAAITAAETGHLVMGTLHTTSAAQTIDRVIDIFSPRQQQQIKIQISQVLVAVLSQVLVPRIGGGRAAAFEIMIATPAVRNLIREGKVFQLPMIMQLGAKYGMQTLEQALADMVKGHIITTEVALSKSSDPEQLKKLLHI